MYARVLLFFHEEKRVQAWSYLSSSDKYEHSHSGIYFLSNAQWWGMRAYSVPMALASPDLCAPCPMGIVKSRPVWPHGHWQVQTWPSLIASTSKGMSGPKGISKPRPARPKWYWQVQACPAPRALAIPELPVPNGSNNSGHALFSVIGIQRPLEYGQHSLS